MLLHDIDVGLLMSVCCPKRSYNPLSDFLSDLLNGVYRCKSRSNSCIYNMTTYYYYTRWFGFEYQNDELACDVKERKKRKTMTTLLFFFSSKLPNVFECVGVYQKKPSLMIMLALKEIK